MGLMVMRCLLEIQENRSNDDDRLWLSDVDVEVGVEMCDYYCFVVVALHFLLDYLDFEINVDLDDAMVGVKGQLDFGCLGLCFFQLKEKK